MDNDNKINDMNAQNETHNDVRLFLDEEIKKLQEVGTSDSYNIVNEYAATKKNKSPFVFLILAGCFLVISLISFIITKTISNDNRETENALSELHEFDDLNLKTLLDSSTRAQTNYDNAVREKVNIQNQMNSQLKSAAASRDNDLFAIESMNIKSKKELENRIAAVENEYNNKVLEIQNEFNDQLESADLQIEEYRKQLESFDAAKIDSAREQEKLLNSERQLKEIEIQSIRNEYEELLKKKDEDIEQIRQQNTNDIRNTITEVSKEYQDKIDILDPVINDDEASKIITELSQTDFPDFDRNEILTEESDEDIVQALNDWQNIYDNYKYIDNLLSAIPNSNSVPSYRQTSRKLVNSLGGLFLDTADLFEERKDSYLNEISSLENEVLNLNEELTKTQENLQNSNDEWASCFDGLLVAAKSNAAVISANSKENIKVFVSPKARYLFAESETGTLDSEIKAGKTIRGQIVQNEDESFNFVPDLDKDGNQVDFDLEKITPGLTIKILAK